jgi:hypothetical protein
MPYAHCTSDDSKTIESECRICGDTDKRYWKDSIHDIDDELEYCAKSPEARAFWKDKQAVISCRQGHLFDKDCIDKYEEMYEEMYELFGARLPCPICKCPVYPKNDRINFGDADYFLSNHIHDIPFVHHTVQRTRKKKLVPFIKLSSGTNSTRSATIQKHDLKPMDRLSWFQRLFW